MNEKLETVKRVARELRELWPNGRLYLTAGDSGYIELSSHDVGDLVQGTDFVRAFGVGKRIKNIVDDWHSLSGTVDGVFFTAYCSGLPPSCRIEIVKEKIPKQQTVDTGEFIEIERRKVVCGHELEAA